MSLWRDLSVKARCCIEFEGDTNCNQDPASAPGKPAIQRTDSGVYKKEEDETSTITIYLWSYPQHHYQWSSHHKWYSSIPQWLSLQQWLSPDQTLQNYLTLEIGLVDCRAHLLQRFPRRCFIVLFKASLLLFCTCITRNGNVSVGYSRQKDHVV